jgi:type I site-specific restriction endonuclease
MPTPNQTPEQKARDHIGAKLTQAGWVVQDLNYEHASVLLERIRAEKEDMPSTTRRSQKESG